MHSLIKIKYLESLIRSLGFLLIGKPSLSKKFSYLVQREFLYKIAQEINLEKFIKFNKKVNKSILADSIESIIGAIYIDGGFNNSYKVIKRIWTPYLDVLDSYEIDPKTKLQEISQKKFKKLPEYKLLNKEGPPHAPKAFVDGPRYYPS